MSLVSNFNIELLENYIKNLDRSFDGFNTLLELDSHFIIFSNIQDGGMLIQIIIYNRELKTHEYSHEFDPDNKDYLELNLKQVLLAIKGIGIMDDVLFNIEEKLLVSL
jgi:hypothetical protein